MRKEPSESNSEHVPVMLDEVVQYLDPRVGGIYVDGTLGLGGHAREILKRIGAEGRLIGIDADSASLELARNNLAAFVEQTVFVHNNYSQLGEILQAHDIPQIDGMLLDLGLSSYQMDNPQRGFSLKVEGPLDMRFNQGRDLPAAEIINTISEQELDRILETYGQERWHQRIARGLVNERRKAKLKTTDDLCRVVLKAIPARRHWQKIHPATRTFQAIRIMVNNELRSLENLLNNIEQLLKPGGRLVVISFHSLEDRIVKTCFREWRKQKKFNILLKKPLRPTEDEVQKNPRARSSRLRAAERVY